MTAHVPSGVRANSFAFRALNRESALRLSNAQSEPSEPLLTMLLYKDILSVRRLPWSCDCTFGAARLLRLPHALLAGAY